jgi:hypothetical protein
MTALCLIFIIIFALEVTFRPRIGFTRERDVLLFYGTNKREYINLGKF